MTRPATTPDLTELTAPLTRPQAILEAQRCLYCYAAPCQQACPTHIEIPTFIRRIGNRDDRGAAQTIFEANALGGTCARVCPVEELCQGACVLNDEEQPIQIGRLQRYATDTYASAGLPIVTPGPDRRMRVLIVGSGPAGLSAAAELRRMGHQVVIQEAEDLPGGLSAYGILPLREPLDVARYEAAELARAGVEIRTGERLGSAAELAEATSSFDAVLLAIGFGATSSLGIENEEAAIDGLAYIRTAKLNPADLPAYSRVAVIGAGNTAIDAATIARRSGAETVLVYRRSAAEAPAYPAETEFALGEGITFSYLSQPVGVQATDGLVTGLRCVRTELGPEDLSGRATFAPIPGSEFVIPADAVIKANGQARLSGSQAFGLRTTGGYLDVDEAFATSMPGVWAAGDVIRAHGQASTVMAVQDGKLAARAIDASLSAGLDQELEEVSNG